MDLPHPYFPIDAHIIFIQNDLSQSELLAIIGTACAIILACAAVLVKCFRPSLALSELLIVLWFTLCSSLHLVFESYFVRHWHDLPQQQDILAQLWKEYALSDSRYLTQDPGVLSLEVITVLLWGPLCLLMIYMILETHAMRHGFQIVVSMAHLYGVVMYYATSLFDLWFRGVSYSRPEPLYFWIYFLAFNAPWLFVPVVLIKQSMDEICRLQQQAIGIKNKAQ